MSPRRAPGFRITDRDVSVVRWVGRLRMASAEQIADRFGLGRAVTYARLKGLVELGLLEHHRVFHASPGVYLASRAGLDMAEVDLPPARIDVRTYAHDLELSGLVAELEHEFAPADVVTEREIRAVEATVDEAPSGAPEFGVRLRGGRGQLQLTPVGNPRLHVPDCVVTRGRSGGHVAVELERTAKGRSRLRSILSAYVSARHVQRVRYVVTDDRVECLVRSEVNGLNAHRLVEVVRRSGAGRNSAEQRFA